MCIYSMKSRALCKTYCLTYTSPSLEICSRIIFLLDRACGGNGSASGFGRRGLKLFCFLLHAVNAEDRDITNEAEKQGEISKIRSDRSLNYGRAICVNLESAKGFCW